MESLPPGWKSGRVASLWKVCQFASLEPKFAFVLLTMRNFRNRDLQNLSNFVP